MRLKRRDETLGLLLSGALLAAGAAAAQDYPGNTETSVLATWLEKNTNIAPGAVVSVTPELVVAIAGKTMPATTGGPLRLTLREEVIAPGYVETVGGRSSLMSMEIHCDERRLRMDERRLYSGPNLTGAVEISDPSAEWVRIPDGSIMDEVARAACDAEYSWPLRLAGAPPAAPGVAVAALETPGLLLPPGPDAKPVPDEPPPPVETAVAEPVVSAPENPPPAEVEPPPGQPEPQVEPAAETETAVVSEEEVAASAEQPPAAALPEPVAENPPPEPAPEIAAPPSAEGVFAAQIGAYETEEAAEEAWAALSANRPVLVEGLRFEVRPVRVKGKDWLRGLVGRFATRKEAAAFCTAIAGSEYGCIVRTLAH